MSTITKQTRGHGKLVPLIQSLHMRRDILATAYVFNSILHLVKTQKVPVLPFRAAVLLFGFLNNSQHKGEERAAGK